MHYLSSPQSLEKHRYERLGRTATLSGGAISRWQGSRIAVCGVGNLGSKLSPEIVRSGASVALIDPDIGCLENLGTQAVRDGLLKVEALREVCDWILPGRARAWAVDARHLGVGELAEVDLLVDATDDPNLTWALTELSNGLNIPLMRMALDGSGQREFGRVAISHGGGGHACSCCSFDLADLAGTRQRQPCLGAAVRERPPTLAGGAIGMTIAGIGLLQAMRLVTGSGQEQALDHEILVDLTSQQMFSVRLPRCQECLTGHVRWSLIHLPQSATELTLVDLFDYADRKLGGRTETLEPYAHPLWTAAVCRCQKHQAGIGGPWSSPPLCAACGGQTQWLPGSQIARWTMSQAIESGLEHRSLAACGLPESGAMFVARAPRQPPVRLVLKLRPTS